MKRRPLLFAAVSAFLAHANPSRAASSCSVDTDDVWCFDGMTGGYAFSSGPLGLSGYGLPNAYVGAGSAIIGLQEATGANVSGFSGGTGANGSLFGASVTTRVLPAAWSMHGGVAAPSTSLFFAATDGYVYSLDANTGACKWRTFVARTDDATITNVVDTDCDDVDLNNACADEVLGDVSGKIVDGDDTLSLVFAATSDGGLNGCSWMENRIFALDASTGQPVWVFNQPAPGNYGAGSPLSIDVINFGPIPDVYPDPSCTSGVARDQVLFSDAHGTAYALSASTGALISSNHVVNFAGSTIQLGYVNQAKYSTTCGLAYVADEITSQIVPLSVDSSVCGATLPCVQPLPPEGTGTYPVYPLFALARGSAGPNFIVANANGCTYLTSPAISCKVCPPSGSTGSPFETSGYVFSATREGSVLQIPIDGQPASGDCVGAAERYFSATTGTNVGDPGVDFAPNGKLYILAGDQAGRITELSAPFSAGASTYQPCSPGATQCNGVQPQQCQQSIGWVDTAACPYGSNSAPVCSGSGACSIVCTGAYLDCDGDPTNGCEIDPTSDVQNCNGCGNGCALGDTCVASTCQGTTCSTNADCPTAAGCAGGSCDHVCPDQLASCIASYCDTADGVCVGCFASPVDPVPGGSDTYSVLSSTLPTATWQSPAAFDPDHDGIWLLGGYDVANNPLNAAQYYDLTTGTTSTPATLPAFNRNGNVNSAVYLNGLVWFGTADGMCAFDTSALTTTCRPAWTYPANNSQGTALATDGQYVYILAAYYSAWRFDPSLALTGRNPWRTYPSQRYSHYNYQGAVVYGSYLYSIGGSFQSTNVERLYIGPPDGDKGSSFEIVGALPGQTLSQAYVRVGQIVYGIGGETDYTASPQAIAYDLLSGESRVTDISLNTPRTFGAAVVVNPDRSTGASATTSIYLLNGYAQGSTYGPLDTIEELSSVPYDASYDNDQDGLQNAFDIDDDNDGIPDLADPCPFAP